MGDEEDTPLSGDHDCQKYLFVITSAISPRFLPTTKTETVTSTNNRQSHTINTRYCYLLKITVSMKLHVSAHDSHHQAYKYCTIKKKNVQLLAGLYIEISCVSQS